MNQIKRINTVVGEIVIDLDRIVMIDSIIRTWDDRCEHFDIIFQNNTQVTIWGSVQESLIEGVPWKAADKELNKVRKYIINAWTCFKMERS